MLVGKYCVIVPDNNILYNLVAIYLPDICAVK